MLPISLLELNQRIKRWLSPAMRQYFWVIAEIAELKRSPRGHCYLELVEKEDFQINAKTSAVIWGNVHVGLREKLGRDIHHILQKGNKVLVKVRVDFHEIYGMKLTIFDLNPSVTVGELELRRLQTIQQLETRGLMELNKQQTLPLVLQRLAVISSPTAAGYGDFVNHLQRNPHGYQVQHQLFPSSMQGQQAEAELVAQLVNIAKQKKNFDCIIIIRGGGSKLDLHTFNSYKMGVEIARCPLPVLTGIGHQQDESVADLVAHTSLKTPTAVAEFVLTSFMRLETNLLHLQEYVKMQAVEIVHQQNIELTQCTNRFQAATNNLIFRQKQQLGQLPPALKRATQHQLQKQDLQLQYLQRTFSWFDITNLLKRGFSITRFQGQAVTNPSTLTKDDEVEIELAGGRVLGKVVDMVK